MIFPDRMWLYEKMSFSTKESDTIFTDLCLAEKMDSKTYLFRTGILVKYTGTRLIVERDGMFVSIPLKEIFAYGITSLKESAQYGMVEGRMFFRDIDGVILTQFPVTIRDA